MRSEDLDRALGATPQSFAERMDQTLRGLKEEKQMKRAALRTVILVTLITLLLCATAFALVNQGLTWYYNNRFTIYQEREPEKHEAIMRNLQTEISLTPADDPDIEIAITEASWAPEGDTLVLCLTAAPRDPSHTELYPIGSLDADGAYGDAELRDEYVMEHLLWTADGYGPVEEMIAPGKQLLLLDCSDVYVDGISLMLGDASYDAFITEQETVQFVLEFSLSFLRDDYMNAQRELLAEQPDNAYLAQCIADMEQLRQRLAGATSVALTIPYTLTPYAEDDALLYDNGRSGEVCCTLSLAGAETPTGTQTLREGDAGENVAALQGLLAQLGYTVEASGTYDAQTVAAVKAFQERSGLRADGIAGPDTQRLLFAAAASSAD